MWALEVFASLPFRRLGEYGPLVPSLQRCADLGVGLLVQSSPRKPIQMVLYFL